MIEERQSEKAGEGKREREKTEVVGRKKEVMKCLQRKQGRRLLIFFFL